MDANQDRNSSTAEATNLAHYLTGYVPVCLPQQQWAHVGDAVRDLVIRTEPLNRDDAKKIAGSLCEFLAWTTRHLGVDDPAVAVTDDNIERWYVSMAGAKADGSRGNQRARLRRIRRVLRGEPARTKRTERAIGDRPYTPTEIDALQRAAAGSPALTAALILGLEQGRDPSTAHGTSVCVDSVATVFSRDRWAAAREAAAEAGIPIRGATLARTWLATQLAQPQPFAQILTQLGVAGTRARLNGLLPHLVAPDADLRRDYLRG